MRGARCQRDTQQAVQHARTAELVTNYFYSKKFPGSIREMTDAAGSVQDQYDFDPFGRTVKRQGGQDSDFQFAGYYFHPASGLSLTVSRAYSANLGKWLSRDPIED